MVIYMYNGSYLLENKTLRDTEAVINSLSKSDFKSFGKPKNIYYNKVRYDGNKPIAFVLAESHNEKGKKVVDLAVAVHPDYRGRGLAYSMAKEAINIIKRDKNIHMIYWGCEKNNQASISLAKKLGFIHDYDTDQYTIFKMNDKLQPKNESHSIFNNISLI